ncbi:uncharacterized protein LOC128725038 [Anopheles nili]|uniref:uncharacterized protein LOC128725038 n=1 Tax=Anopheles nili TaxID=185578 RepID=UPI00237AE351|nr:uncharacterized protein LOC128725038 [Anopheles nili]
MFNERKLTGTGHGFVKAYSNNWLSQLGAVYRYESPKDVLRKPNHQHRKIALYSILAMAFVAFFTLFMIVHEADRRSRQLVIESSFGNETAIEPSAGGYNTVLTTPLSAGNPANGSGEADDPHRSDPIPVNRPRRLRFYDGDEQREAVTVGQDRLVLLPARFLRPPSSAVAPQWASGEDEIASAQRRDAFVSEPKPFQLQTLPSHGLPNVVPVGFRPMPRGNRSAKALSTADWSSANVQELIRQLTMAKRTQQQQEQQQQLYYSYPYLASPQPAEFGHPVHPNHRIKFSGIYRHPRKNGDITTLFGAASQRPREVRLQAPQLINQQLQPDRLYNFKPQNPSEVNLLATEQFRFAPQADDEMPEGWPVQGMPFSVMLNLEPMPMGGGVPSKGTHQQNQRNRQRPRFPYRTIPPYRGQWTGEQSFAQLTPYQQRLAARAPYRPGIGFGQAGSDEYEGENYYRKEGRVYPQPVRVPAYSAPFIGSGFQPGRLMVHFNIYPRPTLSLVAGRKSGTTETTEPATITTTTTTTLAPSGSGESIELNVGELSGKDQPASILRPPESVTPTVEVLKSIEIPTRINFDHVPLGRNPPPPVPSFSRWTSDERTGRLWNVGLS